MNRMVVKSRVRADGILQVRVPLASEDANRDVLVTIEPSAEPIADDSYSAWLKSVAGKWQGDFQRPPEGTLEEREPEDWQIP
jgi:hypothetical protein